MKPTKLFFQTSTHTLSYQGKHARLGMLIKFGKKQQSVNEMLLVGVGYQLVSCLSALLAGGALA